MPHCLWSCEFAWGIRTLPGVTLLLVALDHLRVARSVSTYPLGYKRHALYHASWGAPVLMMEFHISRKARERYKFAQSLFSYAGNVVFANIGACRTFAY